MTLTDLLTAVSSDMDEVAIYPLALTPTQIANHYALRTAP